jgi:hypothetical protein
MKILTFIIFCILTETVIAQDCYTSTVQSPTPFMGNNGEITKLSDGSIWEIQFEYEYMYEYYPSVVACPSRGVLIVNGKKLSARKLKSSGAKNSTDVIESYIESNFTGLNSGNIYRLSNGQIWEQTESWIWTWVWVRPQVMIYKDGGLIKMKVENIDHAVAVRQIK